MTELIKAIESQGLATAALIAIAIAAVWVGRAVYTDFVKPLGGPEGKFAEYLDVQNKTVERQAELLEKHNACADKMATDVSELRGEHKAHATEATDFVTTTTVDLHVIMWADRRLAFAIGRIADDDEARQACLEVDEMLKRHLPPNMIDDLPG